MYTFFAIQKLDILGSKFDFYLDKNKQKRLKTQFGGLLTLLCLTLSLTALTIFTSKLLKKTRPEVSVNVSIANRDSRVDIYTDGVFVVFGMFDGKIFPKTEKTRKYFTLVAERLTTFKQEGRDTETRTVVEKFEMVRCEDLSNNMTDITSQAFETDSGSFFRGAVWCGDLVFVKHWWLQGSKYNLPFTRIRYRIYPCSLEEASECATAPELARSQLLIPFYSRSANFSNYSTPLKGGVDTDLTTLFSIGTKTRLTLWLRRSRIEDDHIDFFRNFGPKNESIEKEKVTSTTGSRGLTLHCTKIEIEDGVCEPYVEVFVKLSKTQTLVERRYYTVLGMVSQVGGFVDLIFLVATFVSQVYYGFYQVRWVRRQLYSGLIGEDSTKFVKIGKFRKMGVLMPKWGGGGSFENFGQKEGSRSSEKVLGDGRVGIVALNRDGGRSGGFGRIVGRGGRGVARLGSEGGKGVVGRGEGAGTELEAFRVDFDYFELMDTSKKSSLISRVLFREYHHVLLPSVIYRCQKVKNCRKTGKNSKILEKSKNLEQAKIWVKVDEIRKESVKEGRMEPEGVQEGALMPQSAQNRSKNRKVSSNKVGKFITHILLQKLQNTQNNPKAKRGRVLLKKRSRSLNDFDDQKEDQFLANRVSEEPPSAHKQPRRSLQGLHNESKTLNRLEKTPKLNFQNWPEFAQKAEKFEKRMSFGSLAARRSRKFSFEAQKSEFGLGGQNRVRLSLGQNKMKSGKKRGSLGKDKSRDRHSFSHFGKFAAQKALKSSRQIGGSGGKRGSYPHSLVFSSSRLAKKLENSARISKKSKKNGYFLSNENRCSLEVLE